MLADAPARPRYIAELTGARPTHGGPGRRDDEGGLRVVVDRSTRPAGESTHVEVGLVAKAYTMLPLFVAKRRGFFAGEGIDCNSEVLGASAPVTAALKSGAIQFSPTTPEGTLLDRANGG